MWHKPRTVELRDHVREYPTDKECSEPRGQVHHSKYVNHRDTQDEITFQIDSIIRDPIQHQVQRVRSQQTYRKPQREIVDSVPFGDPSQHVVYRVEHLALQELLVVVVSGSRMFCVPFFYLY